jgi:hypothetical protein
MRSLTSKHIHDIADETSGLLGNLEKLAASSPVMPAGHNLSVVTRRR